MAGAPPRNASTTGLRPTTVSGRSPRSLRCGRPCGVASRREAAAARRAAGCPVRSVAGGVAPLGLIARRDCPPEPTTAPFFVPVLRTAPRRWEFPAMSTSPLLCYIGQFAKAVDAEVLLGWVDGPDRAVDGVLDGKSGLRQRFADF